MHDTSRLDPETLLTLEQVASMTRSDRQVVLDAVRDRRLRAEQHQGEWRVRVADLRRWVSRR